MRRVAAAAAPVLLLVGVGLSPAAVGGVPAASVRPAVDSAPADPTATSAPTDPSDPTVTTVPADPPDPVTTTAPPTTIAPLSLPVAPASNAIPSFGTAKAGTTKKAQVVRAIVEAGGVAYFGGAFTTLVGPGGKSTASRAHLAAVNGATGALTGWDPHADGTVWSMALSADGQSLYVGGDFSHIGGRSVSHLARLDLATGKVDPSFKASAKGRVRALTLDGNRLYVGGEFFSLDGQARPKLGAVDALTGALLPWTPPALGQGRYLTHTGIPTPDYAPGHVFSIAVLGGKVFASGNFLNFAGQGGLVTLDAATGGLSTPQYNLGRPIFDLTTSGGVLFAVGGGPGGRAWGLSPDTAKPRWTVKFDGDAVGVAASAGIVYVAGHYDYIVDKNSSCYQFCPGGPTRHHLSAFTTAGGKLVDWNPTADTATGPETVGLGAHAVYVGGEFNTINGAPRPGFAIFPGTP